jgi:hypothetical protein
MKLFSLRILLVLGLLVGFGTVSAVSAETASKTLPNDVKIEQWKGHSFTFIARPVDRQAAGYNIFKIGQATQGFAGDKSVCIPYAAYVGKEVTVTETVPFDVGYNQLDYMVYMTVNDTGEKLVGRTLRGQLEGLVLTDDLNNARQQFLGKAVYPKYRTLLGLYVPGQNTIPEAVPITIGSPVTVLDVYTGNQNQKPIWLIVSVNGEKAVLPIAYSWTNMPTQSWTQTPPWQVALFTEDPRVSLGLNKSLWEQIEKGTVEKGMTKEQVRLSWGQPSDTAENDSVWIYGTKKLSFAGDALQSIEPIE